MDKEKGLLIQPKRLRILVTLSGTIFRNGQDLRFFHGAATLSSNLRNTMPRSRTISEAYWLVRITICLEGGCLEGGPKPNVRECLSTSVRMIPRTSNAQRDYREYRQRSDLQRILLMQRFYFAEAVKRIRSRSSLGDEQLLAMLEELSPDTSRYALIMNWLKAPAERPGPSRSEQDVESTLSNATIDDLVDESIAARGRAVKPTKGDDNKSAKVPLKMFELQHADAEETKGMLDNLIGPGEIVIAEKRLNLVIVKGSPEFLAMVEVLLLRLDQANATAPPRPGRG